jgi:hypothetical protein
MSQETGAGTASPLENVINEIETLDFREIVITLTFEGFLPWIFNFDRQTSAEVKRLRQHYYGLKDKEQEAATKQYRLDTLSSLLRKAPQNIPEYPQSESVKDNFIKFFSQEEYEDQLNWLWMEYQAKLYPKEFTSRLSE